MAREGAGMGKLFGTDGIRGVANQYPMTPEIALAVGRAVTLFFKEEGKDLKIVIGKDTRISGDMIEHALVAGICSAGGDALLAGVVPTPAVACLAAFKDAAAGIVISASHNPFSDNGIKLFNGKGFKLADAREAAIEEMILDGKTAEMCRGVRETGRVVPLVDAEDLYISFLKSAIPGGLDLSNMKIVIDASNGATYRTAPRLFADLGADVEMIFAWPDGKNINHGCGSQHPETLMERVKETGADIGLAFDGDGDRLIAVDEAGNVVTGDQILAVCAKAMKEKGTLRNDTVVSTVMSNIGFRLALKEMGIRDIMADVGDRYVMEEMQKSGAVIGGEDSGHMIFLGHHTTGDGILTALKLIEAVQQYEVKPLSELTKIMRVYPQKLMNVEVKKKPDLDSIPEIRDRIASVEKALGEKGRVLIRYSGTQPLCRIMVEGPTVEETERYCRELTDLIREVIGQ